MVTRIKRVASKVVAFLRRGVEVWFVLTILAAVAVLGWLGLDELDRTNQALCRFAHSSAATKDQMIDVLARATGTPDDNPFVVEMHSYVAHERSQLAEQCPTPTEEDLTP